jgi:hypothetical protein
MMWSSRNFYSLLMGMENGTVTLKDKIIHSVTNAHPGPSTTPEHIFSMKHQKTFSMGMKGSRL